MNSNRTRDILIGLAIIIIIILIAVYLIRRGQVAQVSTSSPFPTPVSQFQQELQNNFGITVPSSAIKADLKDVSGGNQVGLATIDKNAYTVIANLNDPPSGYFYQAWLIRGNPGDTNYDAISLGQLSLEKGGWLVNYISPNDLTDHKKVIVTLQHFNNTPETHVLEGSFQ